MRSTELQDRARRAYEVGRLQHALGVVWIWLPLFLVCLLFCGDSAVICGLGSMLYAAAVFLLWRGRVLGRAVIPGFVAGAVALACPLVCRFLRWEAAGPGACGLGGFIAGLALATLARRHSHRLIFFAAGALIAGLLAAMGCSAFGWAGVLGGVVGIAVSGLSALIPSARGKR